MTSPVPALHVVPHAYFPDMMAMGDCSTCGHIAESKVHVSVWASLQHRAALDEIEQWRLAWTEMRAVMAEGDLPWGPHLARLDALAKEREGGGG